jgi:putative membrane protein
MGFLIRLFISTAAVIVSAYLLPGVAVDSFLSAFIAAIIISVLNVLLKPILVILTIPFTIMTLGLFLLVINAILIMLASSLVDGFTVDGFWYALLFSIVLSIVNSLLGGSRDR